MASRSHIRQKIAEYLKEHGPIDDPSGRATYRLREATSYQGSEVGFSQLISAMDRAGELTRDMRGKRTYRIAAGPGNRPQRVHAPSQEAIEDGTEIDYDELATALLMRVTRTLNAQSAQSDEAGTWAKRRIERLERRTAELERDLSRARAETAAIVSERDNLQQQLEHSQGNLAVLTDRLASSVPAARRASNRLDDDERALLRHLRR